MASFVNLTAHKQVMSVWALSASLPKRMHILKQLLVQAC